MIDRIVKQPEVNPDQVNSYFGQFHSSLIQDLPFVQAQMGVIAIPEKPFVFLCLLRCYIQNNQTTMTDCINWLQKTVNEL